MFTYCLRIVYFVVFIEIVVASHLDHKPAENNGEYIPNYDTSYDASPLVSSSSLFCHYHYQPNSLPRGRTKVDFLHFMGRVHTYKACADLCCQYGIRCEVAWLFKNKCFAVACKDKEKCLPTTVPSDAQYTSSLIVMSFEEFPIGSLSPSSSVAMTISSSVAMTTKSPSAIVVKSTSAVAKETPHPTPVQPPPTSHHLRYKSMSDNNILIIY